MRYDKENDILEDICQYENSEIWMMTNSPFEEKILNLLRNYKEEFVDNSGHDCEPPDYYADGSKIMFDVMRINDSEKRKSYNPIMIKERMIQKELNTKLAGSGIPLKALNEDLIVNAKPDGDYDEAHNYKQYLKQFKRTVNKHLESIKDCKDIHPGFKMGFLIFDETDLYIECVDSKEATKPIEGPTLMKIRGFHFPMCDTCFMQTILNPQYKLDFVVWAMPYKLYTGGPYELPRLCIIDLSRFDSSKYSKVYADECMRCR